MKIIEMMNEICQYEHDTEPELLTRDELIQKYKSLKKNWYLSKNQLEEKMCKIEN